MNSSLEMNELIWRFGWMLIHSLWQISLIGLMLWTVLHLTRKRSANLRYWIACCGLAACFVPMIYTFTQVAPVRDEVAASATSAQRVIQSGDSIPAEPQFPAVPVGVPDRHGDFDISDNDPSDPDSGGPVAFEIIKDRGASQVEVPLFERYKEFVSPWIGWLVTLWIAGVCGFAIWNICGWLLVQRLRSQGTPLSSKVLQQRAKKLLERMQIGRVVNFLESMVVEVPVTIGWLKPVVLLPTGLMTSLTTDQVEAVIAHELAHIRRHDYLVNLLQTLTESLLFYHPVVWWLSHTIRVEREFCCDDEAVAVTGDRNCYVSALAAVETHRKTPASAVAFTGSEHGSTLSRMRRLMGATQTAGQGWIAGLSTIVLLLCVGIVVGFSEEPVNESPAVSSAEPVENLVTEAQVQQQAAGVPQNDEFQLDPESFRLEVSYYGESDKPFYHFALRNSPEEYKRTTFHLLERTDDWKEDVEYAVLFKWLRLSGFFDVAKLVDQASPPARNSPSYVLRVASGTKVWEEDLGFRLEMLLRLESLQRVLTGFGLNSDQAPNLPVGLKPLLERLSGYKKLWLEGQLISDLKLQVTSEGDQFPAGSAVPVKIQLQNTGNKPETYEQHILSLVPSTIHVLDEYGRRVPYVGGTSQIQSHQETLDPGASVLLDEFDLAQFYYLRQPGQYLMYAVHGNGIRSNSFRFEITRNDEAEPDFVGRLLPLVHDDWILVANPNFEGEIHPGKNFSKVEGFPLRFQCSPTGSIRDVSHVWIYLTNMRAEPLETPIEQHFLPETSYLGQIGEHHLYAHVDEKSRQRWPDVLDQVRNALSHPTGEEQFLENMRDLKKLIKQQNELLEEHKSETEEQSLEAGQQQSDPVSRLLRKVIDPFGLWLNGTYPIIQLPSSATPREVLAESIKWHVFDKGHIEKYEVLEVRRGIKINAGIPFPEFSAVRIESDQGNQILLMYYQPETKFWWTRFYDTPEVAAEAIEWGKADKGIQVSLSSVQAEWGEKETPALKLSVRNTTEKSVSFIPHIGVCRVEYDGTWYVWGSPVVWGGRAIVVEAGQTADSEIPLKLIRDDAKAWIVEGGQVPLELKPGKHTIRIGLHCNEGPEPVSQVLELSISIR